MANGRGGQWVPSLSRRLEARQSDHDEQHRITGEFVDDMYSSLNRRLDEIQTEQATGFATVRTELAQAVNKSSDETLALRRAIVVGAISTIVALVGVVFTFVAVIR